jgi:hypothetical protein
MEEYWLLADVGWSMSDEIILPSVDPSMMELVADHWLFWERVIQKEKKVL